MGLLCWAADAEVYNERADLKPSAAGFAAAGNGPGEAKDALVRFQLPAQPVDATPSSALIRQCFPGRSNLFGCTRSKPIREYGVLDCYT